MLKVYQDNALVILSGLSTKTGDFNPDMFRYDPVLISLMLDGKNDDGKRSCFREFPTSLQAALVDRVVQMVGDKFVDLYEARCWANTLLDKCYVRGVQRGRRYVFRVGDGDQVEHVAFPDDEICYTA